MAAFNFPDPAVQQTVTNPITGSTYQWKEPPGKWVVTTKLRQVSDIIYEGDTPPDPRGDFKLWYSTDTLELYFWYEDENGVGAWVPTSAPITMLESLEADVQLALAKAGVAEAAANANLTTIGLLDQALSDVENSLGKVTLEEVLTNGNIADKGIVLTNASNDALLLSPEDARIMIGGIGPTVVPRVELRHDAEGGGKDTSVVKLELDENGERFDIECDEKVNNIHFRFENEDKLILNKRGDAVFSGDVSIEGIAKTTGIRNQGDVLLKLSSDDNVIIESGSSYLPMFTLKSYDGPGERKEVFNVKANGSATLLGNLALAPGEQDNQAVTYGQLATVQEQIEQVVPAYERGKYNISQEEVTTNSSTRGRYNLIRKNNSGDSAEEQQACTEAFNTCNRIPDSDPIDCQAEYNRCIAAIPAPGTYDVYITSFSDVQQIRFSQFDADGGKHEWNDVVPGQLIDIFNDDNDDYYVGKITAIVKSNNYVTLDVDKVQAKGNATGNARIKVFTLDNEIDELTNYVRKTGDDMTGKLTTTSPIWIRPNNEGPSGANNMLVVNQSGAASGSIMRICQDGKDIIKVQYDKTTTFTGNRITSVGAPEENKDAANKEYVDNAVASISGGTEGLFAASYWTLDESMDRDEVTQGKFYFDGSDFYMARSNSNGHTWCPGAQGWRTTNAWVTIYSKTGDLMHTFEVNRINFKEKYGKKYIVEFEDTWSYKTKDLVNGEEYVIVIPGFMT